ncbi:MAG TPA: hypothetical protein VHO70_09060, partial [Chitinispirillaceae bacterium]|nr:hypothetical protein [Chitinispirillaceae bacterium]
SGYYSGGKKNGKFIYYYPDQSVKLVSHYTNDKRTGTWTSYHENGKVKKSIEYSDGKERLVKYCDKEGKDILNNLNGKYRSELFYNRYFDTCSDTAIGRSERFLVSGRLKDGYKNGSWVIKKFIKTIRLIGNNYPKTKYYAAKAYNLNFQNGSFVDGWQINFKNKKGIDCDTLTYLMTEPAKIAITESLIFEPQQGIRPNYVIKALEALQQKSIIKSEIESESELNNFFVSNYNHFVQNCSDTMRINIELKYEDNGKVRVVSVKPRISGGFETEVYRVVDLISRVKRHSPNGYTLNYRIRCIEEQEFMK